GTHDLGADPGIVEPGEGVVQAASAAGLADHLSPVPGREHPSWGSFAGMAERCLVALGFPAPEAVERDREVMDADDRHGCCSFPTSSRHRRCRRNLPTQRRLSGLPDGAPDTL